MIWLMTGGRKYTDSVTIERVLTQLFVQCSKEVTHLITGVAPGADLLARSWAMKYGIQPVDCPALWNFYPARGKDNAGARRNTAMLMLEPHWVIAFPGHTGTSDMVNKTREAIKNGRDRPIQLIEVHIDGTYSKFPSIQ